MFIRSDGDGSYGLASDIGSLNYAGSYRIILLRNCFTLKVPQLLLNFLLLPCLSFLCSVFNVQSSMQASLHLLFKSKRSLRFDLGRGFRFARSDEEAPLRGALSLQGNLEPLVG